MLMSTPCGVEPSSSSRCSVSWLSLSPAGASARGPAGTDPLPRLMLWAWERPTDLRGLDAGVGVAFLSQTLIVRNDAVERRAAPQPVARLAAHAARGGDARSRATMRAPRRCPARPSPAWPRRLPARWRCRGSAACRSISTRPNPSAPSIARWCGRCDRRSGPDVPLSITALASWCAQDRWMEGLPVDETVPMLFRMGPDATRRTPASRAFTRGGGGRVPHRARHVARRTAARSRGGPARLRLQRGRRGRRRR